MHCTTPASTATETGLEGLDRFLRDDAAVTSIEYGLMASLIVIVCIGAFSNYASALNNLFSTWVIPALGAL